MDKQFQGATVGDVQGAKSAGTQLEADGMADKAYGATAAGGSLAPSYPIQQAPIQQAQAGVSAPPTTAQGFDFRGAEGQVEELLGTLGKLSARQSDPAWSGLLNTAIGQAHRLRDQFACIGAAGGTVSSGGDEAKAGPIIGDTS